MPRTPTNSHFTPGFCLSLKKRRGRQANESKAKLSGKIIGGNTRESRQGPPSWVGKRFRRKVAEDLDLPRRTALGAHRHSQTQTKRRYYQHRLEDFQMARVAMRVLLHGCVSLCEWRERPQEQTRWKNLSEENRRSTKRAATVRKGITETSLHPLEFRMGQFVQFLLAAFGLKRKWRKKSSSWRTSSLLSSKSTSTASSIWSHKVVDANFFWTIRYTYV